jgi:hypothetical protein
VDFSALQKDWSKIRLCEHTLAEVRPLPGIYQVAPYRDEAKPVYIGETDNLLKRAERTLRGRTALDQIVPSSGEWELRWFELDGVEAEERRGLQSHLIAGSRPVMNYLELAAEDG